MKLFQTCWVALLELFNSLTSGSFGDIAALQQPIFTPDHHNGAPPPIFGPPIFRPPSRPEDRSASIKCDYTAMGRGWRPCSTADDRGCWLSGPNGQEFNITTNYETAVPRGVLRKVCATSILINLSHG
jgi:hypothetical protein